MNRLIQMGVLQGFEDSTVRPDSYITKEQFLALLFRALNIPIQPISEGSYRDVDKERWSYAYIETALNMEIIEKTHDTFYPEAAITREGMAAIISNVLGLADEASLSHFSDLGIERQNPHISKVVAAEIMSGFPDCTFRPQEAATSAQAAVILSNALDYK